MDSKDLTLELLGECRNRVVSVEMKEGSTFTGKMVLLDTKGNIELEDVRCQNRDSSLSVEERTFLRGSDIRLIHLPREFINSPLLNYRSAVVLGKLKRSLQRNKRSRPTASKDTAAEKREKKKLKKLK